jgi:CRP/FNR family transcriptional regulator, cyclic AMP receptor protein
MRRRFSTRLAWRENLAYRRSETIFSHGEAGDSVIYVQKGDIKLSVVSAAGREAIVAMLGPGDFCGEGGLAGQSVRSATATALTSATVLVISKAEMIRALHAEPALSDRFIAYMLDKNTRVEEDLIDQLFNSHETRLARYGTSGKPRRLLPRMSRATLAGMVGTTRSRVSALLGKFEHLGFIDDNDAGITVNDSLLSVVLHE